MNAYFAELLRARGMEAVQQELEALGDPPPLNTTGREFDGFPGCRCPKCPSGILWDPTPEPPRVASINYDDHEWVDTGYALRCNACRHEQKGAGTRRGYYCEPKNEYGGLPFKRRADGSLEPI